MSHSVIKLTCGTSYQFSKSRRAVLKIIQCVECEHALISTNF
jgi:hypothetical protein